MSIVKTESQMAFEDYADVYQILQDSKMHLSNKHPAGNSARIEHDLTELEKSQLDLLKAKLDFEIAKESIEASTKMHNETLISSQRLANRVWWLNAALVLVSIAMAIAAGFELFQ